MYLTFEEAIIDTSIKLQIVSHSVAFIQAYRNSVKVNKNKERTKTEIANSVTQLVFTSLQFVNLGIKCSSLSPQYKLISAGVMALTDTVRTVVEYMSEHEKLGFSRNLVFKTIGISAARIVDHVSSVTKICLDKNDTRVKILSKAALINQIGLSAKDIGIFAYQGIKPLIVKAWQQYHHAQIISNNNNTCRYAKHLDFPNN